MKTKVYAIYDSKAAVYNKPFHQINDLVCMRTVTDLANDPAGEVNKNPQDYSLFHLGEYDDETAKFELLDAPKHIVSLHELVQ